MHKIIFHFLDTANNTQFLSVEASDSRCCTHNVLPLGVVLKRITDVVSERLLKYNFHTSDAEGQPVDNEGQLRVTLVSAATSLSYTLKYNNRIALIYTITTIKIYNLIGDRRLQLLQQQSTSEAF